MGSVEPLTNGNELVGWGSEPYISEYDASGELLLDAVLPRPNLSYRARREPWIGLPSDPPAGAARRQGGKTTVYASWNGATEIASWRVSTSASAGTAAVVATKPRSGFETAIPMARDYPNFTVEALDRTGRVIGASRPFKSTQ